MFILGVVAAQAKTRAFRGSIAETDHFFSYTGAEQTLTVPVGITRARIRLWGGAGAGGQYGGSRYGGNGGYTDVRIDVTAGDVLTIQTGRGGRHVVGANAAGGWPDGGAGSWGDATGGGGGGSTRVFRNTDLVAIAGGGGAGCGFDGSGGGGGGTTGGNASAGGATGASQIAGGASGSGGDAGTGPVTYASRNTQRGGNGGPQGGSTGHDGGGGGGGYYGGAGGGGDARAGSGGSGYVHGDADVNYFLTGAFGSTVDESMYLPFYPGSPIALGAASNTGNPGGDGYAMISLRVSDAPWAAPNDADVAAAWGIPGLAAIYSLRRTVPEYEGPLVHVVRLTDNASVDLYPANDGWIDVDAVETWAAGADVAVAMWYDQSSNGRHAVGTTARPKLVTSGAVDMIDNRPSIRFGGADYTTKTFLRLPFNVFSSDHTVSFAGARMSNSATNGTQWGSLISSPLNLDGISYGYHGTPSVPSLMLNGATDHSTGASTALSTGVVNSFVASGAYAGSNYSLTPYVNGLVSTTLTVNYSSRTLSGTNTLLGAASNNVDHFGGLLSEVVIATTALDTDDRGVIEDALSDIYSGGIIEYPYALTVGNPGFETGVATPWESVVGGTPVIITDPVATGVYAASSPPAGSAWSAQTITMPSEIHNDIDAGLLEAVFAGKMAGYAGAGGNDSGGLVIDFYDVSSGHLGSVFDEGAQYNSPAFVNLNITTLVPAGTRSMRIGWRGYREVSGTQCDAYVDDFSLTLNKPVTTHQQLFVANNSSTSGWTTLSGTMIVNSGVVYGMNGLCWNGAAGDSYYEIALPSGRNAAIDAGTADLIIEAFFSSFTDSDAGRSYVEFYNGSNVIIGSRIYDEASDQNWPVRGVGKKYTHDIPATARFVRFGIVGTRVSGTELSVYLLAARVNIQS